MGKAQRPISLRLELTLELRGFILLNRIPRRGIFMLSANSIWAKENISRHLGPVCGRIPLATTSQVRSHPRPRSGSGARHIGADNSIGAVSRARTAQPPEVGIPNSRALELAQPKFSQIRLVDAASAWPQMELESLLTSGDSRERSMRRCAVAHQSDSKKMAPEPANGKSRRRILCSFKCKFHYVAKRVQRKHWPPKGPRELSKWLQSHHLALINTSAGRDDNNGHRRAK